MEGKILEYCGIFGFLMRETAALVALGLFLATLGLWLHLAGGIG